MSTSRITTSPEEDAIVPVKDDEEYTDESVTEINDTPDNYEYIDVKRLKAAKNETKGGRHRRTHRRRSHRRRSHRRRSHRRRSHRRRSHRRH